MKEYIKIIIITLGILGAAWMLSPRLNIPLGGSGLDTFSTTSIEVRFVGTTATTTVTSNGNTRYARIDNGGTTPIYCLLDGTTAATASLVSATSTVGIRVASSTGGVQNGNFPWLEIRGYTGNINCVGTANTTTTITIAR